MKGHFGADAPDPEARASAPVRSFSVWCHRCKRLAAKIVGGQYTRVECECHDLDKAHNREKMGLPPGAEIPPWGDPLWMRVFGSGSGGGSLGRSLHDVVREAHRGLPLAAPEAPAEPVPEAGHDDGGFASADPAAAPAEAVGEAPIPAPALEVPPEADPDFPDPEEGLPAAESGGHPESGSEASAEGLE